MMPLTTRALFITLLAISLPTFSQNSIAPSPDPKSIPVIDGSLGPCSADFTVTDPSNSPVYDAKIRVHITYGFMNLHKLDLEIGTNGEGKARFIGLPDRIKHGFYFNTSHSDRAAETFYDPANTCKAQFTVTLEKTPGIKAQ